MVIAPLIFAATYLVLAIGRAPGFRLDRAGAALLGASLMVAAGVLPIEEAYRAIDFNTIALLLGMMIVVAHLRLSGAFGLISAHVASRARHPLVLLAAIASTAGLLSAFLVNDTICLVLTPLVIGLVAGLRRNSVPYLLAVAMASNIGSVATITGNPQNMLIGSFSQISYAAFATALAPVAAVGILLTVGLIALVYRREFLTRARLREDARPEHFNRPLALKTGLTTAALIVAIFLGQPPAKVAIISAAALLLFSHVEPQKVYREIDWPLLLMFAGLFIVVAGLERSILSPGILAAVTGLHLSRAGVLTIVTAALSNLVGNVPAVLVLKPFILQMPEPQHEWLAVAMAATLAGNLTLLGSVANLIVVERARAHGISIGFWEYLRVGVPLTLATMAIGVMMLRPG